MKKLVIMSVLGLGLGMTSCDSSFEEVEENVIQQQKSDPGDGGGEGNGGGGGIPT